MRGRRAVVTAPPSLVSLRALRALTALVALGLLTAALLTTAVLAHVDSSGSARLEAVAPRRIALGHASTSGFAVALHIGEIGDGKTVVAVSVVAAVAAAVRTRRWRPVIASTATLGLLIACVETLKSLLGRRSPGPGGGSSTDFGVGGTAFPSGHSAGTLVVFGLVAALAFGPGGIHPSRLGHRVATCVAVVISAAVGIATIVLGWHWPSDVVGGWLLGTAVLVLGNALLRPPPHRGGRSETGGVTRDRRVRVRVEPTAGRTGGPVTTAEPAGSRRP